MRQVGEGERACAAEADLLGDGVGFVGFDDYVHFRVGFEGYFMARIVHERVFDADFPVQIIRVFDGDFSFFSGTPGTMGLMIF